MKIWIGACIALITSACGKDTASLGSDTALTGATPTPTPGPKHIFITAAKHHGRFGINATSAMSAADLFCHLDVNHTDSGTYKALLASTARDPNNSSWILAASTEYLRLDDDAIIGTTNAAGTFDFPLSTYMGTGTTYGIYAWSGLYADWSRGYSCYNWTSNNAYSYGNSGYTSKTDSGSINYYSAYCNSTYSVICVQQ